MYLRQFKQLRLVNLAGNPICKSHDYRSYVLSHIKDLIYLDYRRVNPADVQAAREQHQVRGGGAALHPGRLMTLGVGQRCGRRPGGRQRAQGGATRVTSRGLRTTRRQSRADC